MTPQEFEAWSRHTQRAARGWQLDEVTLRNRGEYLLFRGQNGSGAAGTYVRLADSTVEVGNYGDAIPHIGDAWFKPLGSKTFPSPSAAFKAMVESAGTRALMAILGVAPC